MGVILKSAFWLGLVYSAMPMGQVATLEAVQGSDAAKCAATYASLPDQFRSAAARHGVAAIGRAAILAAAARTTAMLTADARKSDIERGRSPAASLAEGDKRLP